MTRPSVKSTPAGLDPKTDLVVCRGQSMNPTLCEFDLVEVEPCALRDVTPGDIVIAACAGTERPVIHRVAAREAAGLRTRGDDCMANDDALVTTDTLVGRAAAVWRRGGRCPLVGGRAGLRLARLGHARRFVVWRIFARLAPVYNLVVKHGRVAGLVPWPWRPRRFACRSGDAVRHLLVWRGRCIGWRDAPTGTWRVQRPYRLIVPPHLLRD